MARVLLLFAHPRLEKSRTNTALLHKVPRRSEITVRDMYELYPDFDINISKEQELLLSHDVCVWHHPLYWYNAPPLVKQWIDLVLTFGWAYGPGGTQLRGKAMGHVVTTGGAEAAYQLDGFHGFTLDEFLRPLERTVTLCGMRWLPPLAVHGTHRLSDADLDAQADRYARYLNDLCQGEAPAGRGVAP